MINISKTRRRGSPLVMLGLIVVSWVGARAMLWENPFPSLDAYAPIVSEWIAYDSANDEQPSRVRQVPVLTSNDFGPALAQRGVFQRVPVLSAASRFERSANKANLANRGSGGGVYRGDTAQMSLAHRALFSRAFSRSQLPLVARGTLYKSPPGLGFAQVAALDNSAPGQASTGPNRWSFDSWAFFRQGSSALPVSQGRVPVYGASQLGSVLQYRLAPKSRRDPSVYVRAYRALIGNAENEIAVGLSARLIPSLPVRVQAEARITNNAFGTEVRPAILAVTELPVQALPAGLKAEGYAQGGYVGGAANTGFVEGQVALTRQVKSFDLSKTKTARLSVGAAAWGGAQRDAQRIDLGPSVRVDLSIGDVPARVSVDWRERVAGDAEPGSGVAATISTRF